jgi:predicted ATPase/DNA-binding winged helix-turn-helix (wHTH) protein
MTIPTSAVLCDERAVGLLFASQTPVGVDQMQNTVEDAVDDVGLSALRFGRFRVFPKERALLEGDKPVRIGGRALEILIALLERPGQLLSKDELMERVWPKIFVQPSNLTVHIAALRRTLKDGQDGTRWIVNTVGRGYAFVGTVVREGARVPVPESGGTTSFGSLPSSLAPLLGRDACLVNLKEALSVGRLITLVGPGGVGKTALALAAAHGVVSDLDKDACFLELTSVGSATIADAILSGLGVHRPGDSVFASLLAQRRRKLLLVLDGCEALISGAASLVRQLLGNLNELQVLVTSREPLRVEGERVLRVPPLDFAPSSAGPDLHELMTFPAAQLFVEKAKAHVQDFLIDEKDAGELAEICRRLDGLPLAIKLAAARVSALGVSGIARRLSDPFRLLTGGSRGTHPRQQSMRANLDWSYDLLTKTEQAVLRVLSTLEGWFSLEQAAETVFSLEDAVNDPFDAVFELVDKSLVLREVRQGEPLFRLSALTRAYAQMKIEEKLTDAIASDL